MQLCRQPCRAACRLCAVHARCCCACCCIACVPGWPGGGEHVGDSPYPVSVRPGPPCPRASSVSGAGRSCAVAGAAAEFEVAFRDAHGNACCGSGHSDSGADGGEPLPCQMPVQVPHARAAAPAPAAALAEPQRRSSLHAGRAARQQHAAGGGRVCGVRPWQRGRLPLQLHRSFSAWPLRAGGDGRRAPPARQPILSQGDRLYVSAALQAAHCAQATCVRGGALVIACSCCHVRVSVATQVVSPPAAASSGVSADSASSNGGASGRQQLPLELNRHRHWADVARSAYAAVDGRLDGFEDGEEARAAAGQAPAGLSRHEAEMVKVRVRSSSRVLCHDACVSCLGVAAAQPCVHAVHSRIAPWCPLAACHKPCCAAICCLLRTTLRCQWWSGWRTCGC